MDKPENKGLMPHLMQGCATFKAADPEKDDQLRLLLRQSYEIFNIYGKTPESMRSVLLGFHEALSDCALVDIQYAFKFWLKNNSSFPTPADIYAIANNEKHYRELKEANEKKRQELASRPAAISYRSKPEAIATAWDGKPWAELDDEAKKKLKEFISFLPASVRGTYCKGFDYDVETILNFGEEKEPGHQNQKLLDAAFERMENADDKIQVR